MGADFRTRVGELPWTRIAIGVVLTLFIIGVVPPFRRAAVSVTSRIILLVASPLSPGVGDFDKLSKATRVLAADGSEVGQLGAEQREPVRLDKLPPHVSKAVLAAEDANFYNHSGVDPSAVFRAAFNRAKGGNVTGGSTLTQQLAKLNFTGSQRSIFRKLKEVLYASKLESKYSKNELLEHYLNQVYFGQGAYGIGLASQTYFAIPPEQLNPAQAAMLAGKIHAPNALDPYRDPAKVQARRDQVLKLMKQHGWVSGEELSTALASPLNVAPDPGSRSSAAARGSARAPQFVSYVGREAAGIGALGDNPDTRRKQIFTGGYTVETTLDMKGLDAARGAAEKFLGAKGDPTTTVVSIQPGDGAVRVLFGGLDPKLEFDPASQGKRQPGSSFKPYVYLAMLEKGIDPRTTFDSSSPQTLNCKGSPWPVENFEGKGGGRTTVDQGLTDSINTVFAQVMTRVGPDAVQKVAEKAGIPHDAIAPAECAMALGGLRRGVSPLDQAVGFSTFAAKGTSAMPYAITRIKDRNGKVVYQHKNKTSQAIDDKEVGVLNGALKRVVEAGTGRAAGIGRPLAGKTGTSEHNGNAWFVGFVPQLATSVWVGYPEGDRPMTNVHGIEVTGGSFPARIFSQYMRAVLAGVPVQEIYTVSPDELNLKGAPETKSSSSTTSNSSTTSSSSTTSPSVPDEITTLPTVPPITLIPPVTVPPTTKAPKPTPTPTTAVSPTTGPPPTVANPP